MNSWKTPFKNDIIGVKVLHKKSICAIGLDNEILFHDFEGSNRPPPTEQPSIERSSRLKLNHASFRSFQKWSGIAVLENDLLLGKDRENNLYLVNV